MYVCIYIYILYTPIYVYVCMYVYIYIYIYIYVCGNCAGRGDGGVGGRRGGSKERDPNPTEDSWMRKETSTCKGYHSTFAAFISHYSQFGSQEFTAQDLFQGLGGLGTFC